VFSLLFYNESLYVGSQITYYQYTLHPFVLKDTNVSFGRFFGLNITNNSLYATAASGGLVQADVTEQYKWKNVSTYKVGDTYSEMLIVDNKYLYTLVGYVPRKHGWGVQIRVFDISNNSVTFVKSINTTNIGAGWPTGETDGGAINSISLYNNTTILFSSSGSGASSLGGFYYVDISNRTNPIIIKRTLLKSDSGNLSMITKNKYYMV